MSPSTRPEESASPSDALDRMLRPDPRADLADRLRDVAGRLDRRVLITAVVIAALGVVGWALLVRGGEPAELSLPNAASPGNPTSLGAAGPTTGVAASGAVVAATTTALAASTEVVVHVAGAVVHPGLLHLSTGVRVADAVAAAGGPTPDADIDRLNLAQPVADGSRVVVPRIGEVNPAPSVGATPPGGAGAAHAGGDRAATPAAPVDLNTADETELESLPGVGPSTAKAIIDHRTESGPFHSVDDLLDVRGIGPAKLEALRGLAVVDGS